MLFVKTAVYTSVVNFTFYIIIVLLHSTTTTSNSKATAKMNIPVIYTQHQECNTV